METLNLLRKDQTLRDRISTALEEAKAKGIVAEPETQKFPMKRPKQEGTRVPVTDPDSFEAPDEIPAENEEGGTQVTDV
jgi:hypothetical protein